MKGMSAFPVKQHILIKFSDKTGSDGNWMGTCFLTLSESSTHLYSHFWLYKVEISSTSQSNQLTAFLTRLVIRVSTSVVNSVNA